MSTAGSETGNSRGKRARGVKAKKPKGAARLKCSLMLTSENDLRLTVLASLRGTDRSTLINAILDDSLRGVVVSLRGALAVENGGAGEGASASEVPGDLSEEPA